MAMRVSNTNVSAFICSLQKFLTLSVDLSWVELNSNTYYPTLVTSFWKVILTNSFGSADPFAFPLGLLPLGEILDPRGNLEW